jgi:DNA modification methylase
LLDKSGGAAFTCYVSHGAAKSKAGIESDKIVIPLTALAPDPANARKMNDAARAGLGVSMETFGELGLVFNDRTGQWVSGHQRYERLLAAGASECVRTGAEGYIEHPKTRERFRVRFVDWDETKQRMANLVANNPKISGEFTEDALAQLKELEGEEGFELLALDELEKELAAELGVDDEATAGNCDPDDVPDPPAEPFSKRGDLWILGEHRILCGDSTSAEDVARLLDGVAWNCCLFDPPYEVTELYAHVPKVGHGQKLAVFWDMFHFATAAQAALTKGWAPLYELVWDCVTSWYTPNRPLARHKACGVFGDDPKWEFEKAIIRDGKERKAGTVHNTRGDCEYEPLDGAVHMRTVESFPTCNEDGGHKHSKPEAWIKGMLLGMGARSVLDLFGGSGTALVASEQIGSRCFTMELDPASVDVCVARWEKFTRGKGNLVR